MDNNVVNCEPEQTEEVTEEDKQVLKDNKSDVEIGKIVFVSCAAGSEETNLDDVHNMEEVLNETNSDQIDNGKNSLFPMIALVLEFAAFCVCAIVCILILENNISESIQPDSNSCEISRIPSLLKEGIIKDGLTGPSNGNLFLN